MFMMTFNQYLDEAKTLVYIDLAYVLDYWLAIKRLLRSLCIKPEGWPEGYSVLKDFWNDDFRLN
jgi:hypothetical protein